MRQVNKLELAIVCVLGIILFGMALVLVNVQYRVRTLFVEHERAVEAGRRLEDDQAELLIKVRKASLPGSIAGGAQRLGLVQADNDNTVNLVLDKQQRVTVADGMQETVPVTAGGRR